MGRHWAPARQPCSVTRCPTGRPAASARAEKKEMRRKGWVAYCRTPCYGYSIEKYRTGKRGRAWARRTAAPRTGGTMARVIYGVWDGVVQDNRGKNLFEIEEPRELKGFDAFNQGQPDPGFHRRPGLFCLRPEREPVSMPCGGTWTRRPTSPAANALPAAWAPT